MEDKAYKEILEKEIIALQITLDKVNDRVTTLEIVRAYHKTSPQDILKWLSDNAEIIMGAALFLVINLILWERLS